MKSARRIICGSNRTISGWQKSTRPAGPSMPDHDAALPQVVDLGPLCPPVNDQGQIGSCVANAICEAMEFLQRRGADDQLLSRLYLYYWARADMGVPPGEDSGLDISSAVETATKRGIPPESVWPYAHPEQRFSVAPTPEADAEALKHKTILAFDCPTLFTIKASLMQGFPLVMGMRLPSIFMGEDTASSGRVPFATNGWDGGHSMLAIGYDDSMVLGPDDVGALLIRNSWSELWGQSGNCWLSYKYVTEGIASDFTSIRRVTL